MIDETISESLQDTTLAELEAENGDYSEYFALISDNQLEQIQAIKEQSDLIAEQNALLSDVSQACYWIFFILAFYGVYKIFLGNIASWFNGC